MTYESLCNHVARMIRRDEGEEFEGVPHVVVRAALEHGLRFLANRVPHGFDVSEVECSDLDLCERCDNLLDTADLNSYRRDSENAISLCLACADEAPAAAAPAAETKETGE